MSWLQQTLAKTVKGIDSILDIKEEPTELLPGPLNQDFEDEEGDDSEIELDLGDETGDEEGGSDKASIVDGMGEGRDEGREGVEQGEKLEAVTADGGSTVADRMPKSTELQADDGDVVAPTKINTNDEVEEQVDVSITSATESVAEEEGAASGDTIQTTIVSDEEQRPEVKPFRATTPSSSHLQTTPSTMPNGNEPSTTTSEAQSNPDPSPRKKDSFASHQQKSQATTTTPTSNVEATKALTSKVTTLTKERDAWKRKYQELAKKRSASREADAKLKQALAEKETMIAELLDEGKTLQQSQMRSARINKSLEAKLKESETQTLELRKKLTIANEKIQKVEKQLTDQAKASKSYQKSASEVTAMAESQSRDLRRLESEVTTLKATNAALESALEKATQQVEELEVARSKAETAATTAIESANLSAQHDIESQLTAKTLEFDAMREDYLRQIDELRLSITKQQAAFDRKEQLLMHEVADVRQQLRDADDRAQDITQNITHATEPLLRQIASLKETAAAERASHQNVTSQLMGQLQEATERMTEAEAQLQSNNTKLVHSQSRCKTLEDTISSLRSQHTELSQQLSTTRQQTDLITQHLEASKQQASDLEVQLKEKQAEWHRLKSQLEDQIMDERTVAQLEAKAQVEAMRRQLQQQQQPTPTTQNEHALESARDSTQASSRASPWGSQLQLQISSSTSKLHEESKDAKIASLQAQLLSSDQARKDLSEEVMQLMGKIDELTQTLQEKEADHQDSAALKQRYTQLLEMYGEKAEEYEELKMDLQDVKQVFRMQIDALLSDQAQAAQQAQDT
eukprot:m.7290 g.7290  ORF g.7290 m.7290 type:complete len:806 (-) comp5233_c0_seq1:1024-3441(-)